MENNQLINKKILEDNKYDSHYNQIKNKNIDNNIKNNDSKNDISKNLENNEHFNNKNILDNKKINSDIEKIIKYYQSFSDDKNNIQNNNQNLENYNYQNNLNQNCQLSNDNIVNGKSLEINKNNKEEINKIPIPNNISLNNRNNIKPIRNIETKSNESKTNTQNDDLTYSNDYILSEDDNTNNSNFFNKNNTNQNNSNIQSNNTILNTDNNINNDFYYNKNNDNNNDIKNVNNNNNIKKENNIKDNLNNKKISKKNSETQTIIEKPVYKKISDINININSNTTRNPTNKIFQQLKEKNKKIMLDEGTQYYEDIDKFTNNIQNNLILDNFEKLIFQDKLNKLSTNIKKQKKISSIDFDNSENLTSYSRKNESQRQSYVNILKNSSTKKFFSPLIEKELIHYPSTNHFFNSNNNTSNNNSNNFKSNYFKINTDDFYNISPRQKVLEEGNNNIYNIPRHYTNNKKTETKYQKSNNDFLSPIYNRYNNFNSNSNNKMIFNNNNINKKTLFSPQKSNIDDFEKIKIKFFKNEKREFNKNCNIMPPNPYETVLNAREFFFFNK